MEKFSIPSGFKRFPLQGMDKNLCVEDSMTLTKQLVLIAAPHKFNIDTLLGEEVIENGSRFLDRNDNNDGNDDSEKWELLSSQTGSDSHLNVLLPSKRANEHVNIANNLTHSLNIVPTLHIPIAPSPRKPSDTPTPLPHPVGLYTRWKPFGVVERRRCVAGRTAPSGVEYIPLPLTSTKKGKSPRKLMAQQKRLEKQQLQEQQQQQQQHELEQQQRLEVNDLDVSAVDNNYSEETVTKKRKEKGEVREEVKEETSVENGMECGQVQKKKKKKKTKEDVAAVETVAVKVEENIEQTIESKKKKKKKKTKEDIVAVEATVETVAVKVEEDIEQSIEKKKKKKKKKRFEESEESQMDAPHVENVGILNGKTMKDKPKGKKKEGEVREAIVPMGNQVEEMDDITGNTGALMNNNCLSIQKTIEDNETISSHTPKPKKKKKDKTLSEPLAAVVPAPTPHSTETESANHLNGETKQKKRKKRKHDAMIDFQVKTEEDTANPQLNQLDTSNKTTTTTTTTTSLEEGEQNTKKRKRKNKNDHDVTLNETPGNNTPTTTTATTTTTENVTKTKKQRNRKRKSENPLKCSTYVKTEDRDVDFETEIVGGIPKR